MTKSRVRGRWSFAILAVAMVAVGASGAEAAKRVALLIGNQDYRSTAALKNPVNDIELMRRTLLDAGFDDVEAGLNLDLADMRKMLRAFEDKAEGAEVAVLYYSGHGMEMNGQNYLIPVDAVLASDKDVEDETMSLDRAERALNGATRLKLVILDACRNNPFLDAMTRSAGVRALHRGLARVEPESADTLVAYASRAGTVALDGSGRNSPFAQALSKYLAQPGVDIRIALGQVRDEVLKVTERQQEPFVYGSLGGAQIFLSVKQLNVTINSGGQQPSAGAPAGLSSAATDWQNIRDLADADLLQAFISRHGDDPVYRMLAEKKLKLLAKAQAQTEASPDQIAWEALRGSTDAAAIRRFIDRYPQSKFRHEAEVAVGMLEPVKNPTLQPVLTPAARECHVLAGEPQGSPGFAGVTLAKIDAKRALAACAQAVDADPNNASLINLLGRAHEADRNFAEARSRYEKAAALGDMFALTNLGWLSINGSGQPADPASGLEALEKAAAAGNHSAQASLGLVSRDGLAGQAKDNARAIKWFERAAKQGNAAALGNLGWFYREGVGVARDYARSIDYYRRGADAGDIASTAALGYAAQNGFGVAQDYAAARAWYEKGANAGDPYSMASLGFLYDAGTGVKQDFVEARYWYEKAANAGSAYAMANLSRLYDQGLGTSVDPDEAVRWAIAAISLNETGKINELKTTPDSVSPQFRTAFQKALKERGLFKGAADGVFGDDTLAAIDALAAGKTSAEEPKTEADAAEAKTEQVQPIGKLGAAILAARGPSDAELDKIAFTANKKADTTLARQCYKLAGEPGSEPGFAGVVFEEMKTAKALKACAAAVKETPGDSMLWDMLGRAQDQSGDYPLARRTYVKAAAMGNVYAYVNLAWLTIYGNGEKADVAAGMRRLERAAKAGNAFAQSSLGWIYREGYGGIAQDYDAAAGWYKQAAAQGHPNALASMGWFYREGLGGPKDLDRSLEFYRKAAKMGELSAIGAMGYALQNGLGVAIDTEEARRWYEKGASRNDAYCMGSLAWLYEAGEGAPQNYAKARELYAKAADAGSSYAQGNLARLFDSGQGGPVDVNKAAELTASSIAGGETSVIEAMKAGALDFTPAFRRSLQKLLKKRGLYAGPADGAFGPTTSKAIDKLAGQG